jgi:hypothetical protein
LAIGLLDSAPQAKRIANPLQDTILPHNICENAPAGESFTVPAWSCSFFNGLVERIT